MSCLSQHKTKEELSDWLMDNASDNETTGFLDMLAGDIWDMMNAENELEEETSGREHDVQQFQSVLEEKGQLEAEVEELKEENKKLKEDLEKAWDQRGDKWRKARNKKLEAENKKLEAENKKLKKDIKEYRGWVDRNQAEIERLQDVINCETDSEEEDDVEDNDPQAMVSFYRKNGTEPRIIAEYKIAK